MAETIQWKISQASIRKRSPANYTYYLLNTVYNNSAPTSGSLATIGYLTKITVTITNLGGLSDMYEAGGSGTTEYYVEITFKNGQKFTSDIQSVTINRVVGLKHTRTFTIEKVIPLSGSESQGASIAIYGRTTTRDDFYLCRDGGTITITYEGHKGGVKYYNNSNWEACTINYYDGSKWVPVSASYYDGAKWNPVG